MIVAGCVIFRLAEDKVVCLLTMKALLECITEQSVGKYGENDLQVSR